MRPSPSGDKKLAAAKKTGKSAPLEQYREKRDFTRTREPSGEDTPAADGGDSRRFIVHKHHARTLHYDLRLESQGVLRSWAVPKGPSLDPGQKRLAIEVEDHPLDYGDFEGTIPEGEYGAGTVIIWDRGSFEAQSRHETFEDMLHRGTAKFFLRGGKLRGGFALVRTKWGGRKNNWLLIKEKDDHALPGSEITAEEPLSIVSGRDVDDPLQGEHHD
jgi:bifunctional non-homologous end joining protein LigD